MVVFQTLASLAADRSVIRSTSAPTRVTSNTKAFPHSAGCRLGTSRGTRIDPLLATTALRGQSPQGLPAAPSPRNPLHRRPQRDGFLARVTSTNPCGCTCKYRPPPESKINWSSWRARSCSNFYEVFLFSNKTQKILQPSLTLRPPQMSSGIPPG